MLTPTRQAVQRMGHTVIILQLLTDRLVWRMLVTRQHMLDAQRTIDETERLLDQTKRAARRRRLYLALAPTYTHDAHDAHRVAGRARQRNKHPAR